MLVSWQEWWLRAFDAHPLAITLAIVILLAIAIEGLIRPGLYKKP